MNFKDGIVGIFLPIVGIILKIIYDFFQKKIEDKEIVKQRLVKYFIASICIVIIYFFVIYGILNRNFVFKVSPTESDILLSIFFSSMIYFYFNSIVSTFVMEHLETSSTSKITKLIKRIGIWVGNYTDKKRRSIIMIGFQFLFIILFSIMNGFYGTPKSVVVENTVVSNSKDIFELPAESTFKPIFKSGKPSNLNKNDSYEYKSQDNVYILPKGSKIKLFKWTELIIKKNENENIIYQKENDEYLDKLKPSKKTTILLDKDIIVKLEKDSMIMLSKTDNIWLQLGFIHLILLCFSLAAYYFWLLMTK